MSPKLPRLSGKGVVRALSRAAFAKTGQRGSHVKFRHEDGRTVIVPMHRELAHGALASIIRQEGMTADQLTDLL